MQEAYLLDITKQFQYYKSLGDKTFAQLEEQDLFWQYHQENNSIAIIVNHLWGNMTSRWTDFLTSDGEKSWRQRDLEFQSVISSKTEMLQKWENGWDCLFKALASVQAVNINTKVYIRNQTHTIFEAINRQLAHYAYHVGQIVYIGIMVKANAWNSLSIPKGKSAEFNAAKLSKGTHGGHFSDDLK